MTTRIAVPVAGDLLCAHFGQCEAFALFDVDPDTASVVGRQDLQPPPHEHGAYPKWLADQGTTLVIAGGMGGRARALFAHHGIQTVLGADEQSPQAAVTRYLRGDLPQGDGHCDHGCDH